MNPWRRNPFFRIVLPFLIGVAFADELWPDFAIAFLYALFLALGAVLVLDRSLLFSPLAQVKGLIICTLFFVLGVVLANKERQPAEHALTTVKRAVCIGEVKDSLRSFSFGSVDLIKWRILDKNRALITAQDAVTSQTLILGKSRKTKPGDRIIGHVVWEKPQKARFDGQFDEEAYLAASGIFVKAKLYNGNWCMLSSESAEKQSRLSTSIQKIRDAVEQTLNVYIPDNVHLAVMKALLLGDRKDIPGEVRQKLAGAGITHVLAVSGLHVGIVYWILGGLLNMIFHGRLRRYMAPPIMIICLAAYAMLTGASPSVVRATLMLSIVLLARAFSFKGSTINTVLFTGFVILLFQPSLLYNIGFQLSFLAVFGILWIYPRLKMWYYPKAIFLRKITDIIYVSLAAQLATTPISIATFHIFPNYFILSNLLIAPLLMASLYSGILLVLCNVTGIASVAGFAGKCISALLGTAFNGVNVLETLPGFVLNGLYIPKNELLWVILAIGLVLAALFYRQRIFLKLCAISLLAILALEITGVYYQSTSSEMITLEYQKQELAILRSGRNALIISELSKNELPLRLRQDVEHCIHDRRIHSMRWCKPAGFITSDNRLWDMHSKGMLNEGQIQSAKTHAGMPSLSGKRQLIVRLYP